MIVVVHMEIIRYSYACARTILRQCVVVDSASVLIDRHDIRDYDSLVRLAVVNLCPLSCLVHLFLPVVPTSPAFPPHRLNSNFHVWDTAICIEVDGPHSLPLVTCEGLISVQYLHHCRYYVFDRLK